MCVEDDQAKKSQPAIKNGSLKQLVEHREQPSKNLQKNLTLHNQQCTITWKQPERSRSWQNGSPMLLVMRTKSIAWKFTMRCWAENAVRTSRKRLLTCDEKWILFYNDSRSAQEVAKDGAPKHMPEPALHHCKVVVTVSQTARKLARLSPASLSEYLWILPCRIRSYVPQAFKNLPSCRHSKATNSASRWCPFARCISDAGKAGWKGMRDSSISTISTKWDARISHTHCVPQLYGGSFRHLPAREAVKKPESGGKRFQVVHQN